MFLSPHPQVEQAYKQYIRDTVKLFDASGPDALEFAATLYNYESRIAEITPKEEVLQDPVASNHVISIGELAQIARSVSNAGNLKLLSFEIEGLRNFENLQST